MRLLRSAAAVLLALTVATAVAASPAQAADPAPACGAEWGGGSMCW